MFDKFYLKVSDIINRNLPQRPLSRKEVKFQSKPWITQGLKISINNKNRLYRCYLRTSSTYSHSKYKSYRNKLNRLIKLSKMAYYKEYFMVNKSNNKEIWKGIRQIITLKVKDSFPPGKLIKENDEINNIYEITN